MHSEMASSIEGPGIIHVHALKVCATIWAVHRGVVLEALHALQANSMGGHLIVGLQVSIVGSCNHYEFYINYAGLNLHSPLAGTTGASLLMASTETLRGVHGKC